MDTPFTFIDFLLLLKSMLFFKDKTESLSFLRVQRLRLFNQAVTFFLI
jgi:hypothetical protein